MRRPRGWICWLAAGAGLALAAQSPPPLGKGSPGRPGMRAPIRRVPMQRPDRKVIPRRGGPQNMVDHLMSLPPEAQREFMRANPRFRNLHPRQQENIQRRLEQFNRMPEARREALRERYELFRQLPPDQQDRARHLYRRWNQHSPERRQQLMREFRQLREATPEERRRRMESEEFRNRHSESEQEMLRGLAGLLPEQDP